MCQSILSLTKNPPRGFLVIVYLCKAVPIVSCHINKSLVKKNDAFSKDNKKACSARAILSVSLCRMLLHLSFIKDHNKYVKVVALGKITLA